ncbi:hypothetical protein FB451DRAFT_1301403 [Mycena latifolia]|nr:hypothetical protein FB451DRAFT_1301403 [Mycena latifolia]
MPCEANETQEEFITRLLAISPNVAEDTLSAADFNVRSSTVTKRKEKEEADRKAKEETDRKAKEEEKWKKDERKRKRKGKQGGEPSGSSGGNKGKGKSKEVVDEDDEEEVPSKKAKFTPCDRCAKKGLNCTPGTSQSSRRANKSCAPCQMAKSRCEHEASDADRNSTLYGQLTRSFEDLFDLLDTSTLRQEHLLEDLRADIQDMSAYTYMKLGLQLAYGDKVTDGIAKIAESRKERDRRRKEKQKAERGPEDKGEGPSKGKKA